MLLQFNAQVPTLIAPFINAILLYRVMKEFLILLDLKPATVLSDPCITIKCRIGECKRG